MSDSDKLSGESTSVVGQDSPLNIEKLNSTFMNNAVMIQKILGDSFDDLIGSLDDLNKQIDDLM